MQTSCFAFEPDGKAKVEIEWGRKRDSVSVRVDGVEVAAFDGTAAFNMTPSIELADGSLLEINYDPRRPTVRWDGRELKSLGSLEKSTDPPAALTRGTRTLYSLAVLNLVLILMPMFASWLPEFEATQTQPPNLHTPFVLLVASLVWAALGFSSHSQPQRTFLIGSVLVFVDALFRFLYVLILGVIMLESRPASGPDSMGAFNIVHLALLALPIAFQYVCLNLLVAAYSNAKWLVWTSRPEPQPALLSLTQVPPV